MFFKLLEVVFILLMWSSPFFCSFLSDCFRFCKLYMSFKLVTCGKVLL